jgi:phenylalanyl-tRNA synthetase alpha subunit
MKKEKFLQEVNRLKGNTNLKSQRIALGKIDDIRSLMSEAEGYDLRSIMDSSDNAKSAFLSELSSLKNTADEFVDYNIDLEGKQWDQMEVLNKIVPLIEETEASLESLGLDNPEFNQLLSEYYNLDELNRVAFDHTQTDTDIHNEAAALSDRA